jgi:hypothetical protein
LPHFFLDDGRSLYDLLGTGLSLLVVGESNAAAFEAAAAARAVPLRVIHLPRDPTGLLGATALLVRPDQHIAWRGEADTPNAGAAIDLVRGV